MNIVHSDRIPPNAWRNGAGTARTLLQWPSPENFQVHVALADITRDSPFSHYPGMQRWFQALSEEPVVLVHGAHSVTLNVASAPHEFEGGDAPRAELQGGPIQDLSFMGPACAGHARMQALSEGEDIIGADTWRGVFTQRPAVLWCDGLQVANLTAQSLAWDAGAGLGRWQLRAATSEPLCAWALHWKAK